jgi:hypothetical protein
LASEKSVYPWNLSLTAGHGALVAYYLLWKYVVGFVNRVLGIAEGQRAGNRE